MTLIQDDIVKMRYVVTVFTDLANLYRHGKISSETCAEYFSSLMRQIFGYQELDAASLYLANLMKMVGREPNFYVEEIHGDKEDET